MPREVRSVACAWSPERAFAYLSDFSNAQEWDPGVTRAVRLDDGPLASGSAFDLDVRTGRGTRRLRYVVTRLAPSSVTFEARDGALRSRDTVTVEPVGERCTVTYEANLWLHGAAGLANPLLAILFRRLVDRAAASLTRLLAAAP